MAICKPDVKPDAKTLWAWWLCVSVGLVSCGDAGDMDDDLEQKLQAIHQKPVVPVPSESPSLPVLTQSYQAAQDPFVSPLRQRLTATDANAKQTDTQDKPKVSQQDASQNTSSDEQSKTQNLSQDTRNTTQASITADDKTNQPVRQADTTLAQSTPIKPVINAKRVQIDAHRSKQALEQFELTQLRYQGRIEQHGKTQALVSSPDGLVHLVSVGDHLGLHHGRVVGIYAGYLHITQAVLHSDGHHYQRDEKLILR